MPKIFKQNKFALASANILLIAIWIPISSLIVDLITYQEAPFYIYKLGDLIKIIPPIWITYYLWIKRKGFK
tara:strand:+ start:12727 stop:12939 length:213 start_codon:yes stop_codon:yes gene_type:complete